MAQFSPVYLAQSIRNGWHNLKRFIQVDISKSQLIRYEGKGVQPPAHTLNKMAELFGTSVDYLINGNTGEKAQSTLRDAELIKQFRHIEELPEDEKNTIIKVITAYVRDFKTRQAYVG